VHGLYSAIWSEQLGQAWREPTPPFAWPVLDSPGARWWVRAAIDAVVAQAYGLNRNQYAHVLSTFSHKSYPKAPDLCLAAFDELTAIGLEAFTRKHDPYWDVPLNMSLPKPVIDLPGLSQDAGTDGHATAESSTAGFTLAPIEDRPRGRGRPPKVATAPRPVIGDLFANQPVELRGGVEAYGTIKRLLDERGVITSVDAQMATGLESADVRPVLKKLVDEGFARVEGVTKGTRYVRVRGAGG